ncbi:MAG: GNAT family N-acetyltransferase [Pararhodobacter sp.]
MRPLTPSDRPALETFLHEHLAGSMFPLSNLAGRGRAMQVWCCHENAHIAGMLGLTEDGMLLPQWLRDGSHRLLRRAGQIVALTGFNADLGDAVQVGGVYCPPALRGRGLARLAVALHLAEARARGATRAVLFAASAPAVRAYRALGFQPADEITLVLFASPQRVPSCP